MTLTKTNSPREIERKFLLKNLPDGLTNFPHEEIAALSPKLFRNVMHCRFLEAIAELKFPLTQPSPDGRGVPSPFGKG